MIGFGVLFPPLAVVIAISIWKELLDLRVALGRWQAIIEATQDPSLKERLLVLSVGIDNEWARCEKQIVDGVGYGLFLSTLIWAFVLLDTSEGSTYGICMSLIIAAIPIVTIALLSSGLIARSTDPVKFKDTSNIVDNPLFAGAAIKSLELKSLN